MITKLQKQVRTNLNSKMRIGQSRHNAKNEVREERKAQGKSLSAVDIRVDTIHSMNTYNTYLEHCSHFVDWCINEKGVNQYSSLNKIEKYAKEYLQYREEKGLSLYTLKAEKAALGKLYSHEIDYKFKESRTIDKITRSRKDTERQKHFSEERNKDLVNIAKGTGGRREDIAKLTRDCFFIDKNGNMFVKFEQSKGGRDRIAPVLPAYQKEIEIFIKTKEKNEPLFDKIHNAADIHAYRREYAQELYKNVCDSKELREEYAKMYPLRNEQNIKGDYYIAHDKNLPFKGLRDNIYIVSEALGHNRLDVSVNHYLK